MGESEVHVDVAFRLADPGGSMSRLKLVCVALLLAAATASGGDDTSAEPTAKPTSPAALAALKKYERLEEKARQEYARVMASAERQLDADLGPALKQAVAAGNLDEGNRINAVRKESDARLKADQEMTFPAPAHGTSIFVVSARYGTVTDASDVTRVVRPMAKGNRFEVPGNFYHVINKDPAPGALKSFSAVLDIGGRRVALLWQDTGLPFRCELLPPDSK